VSTNPEGATHQPYISADKTVPELTIGPLVVGALLGLVFAASSVYLGLKVGLTVSASIPVAVMSITLFRWATRAMKTRQSTILENNIAQTTGSAGESIAAGVAFTLPSLLLMGFEMDLPRILLVALFGGLIGVLMMIPLRHGLIVQEHGKLSYPEGTACADVLVVGEQGGTNAKTVFQGFFVGLGYTVLNLITKLWQDTASFAAEFGGRLKGASLSFEVSPPMLGVGYIIGPRVAANMMAGGALAFMILVPLIHLFGDGMTTPMYPATLLIKDMSAGQIRNNYILYIGAGAVATGGFIALARAIPSIINAFRGGLKNLSAGQAAANAALPRTQQDLSMKVVLGGSIALALAIAIAPPLEVNPVSAILIVIFGFFFVTVSSRITGEIGSSSNPISGMTVATLLITCGLFVAVGWVGVEYKAMALTTAALVCVAASNGGTISQDLKTGFLVGSTPKYQQISILVGVVTSAILIGVTLQVLNKGATTYKPVDFAGATLPITQSDTQPGPDGKTYKVTLVKEDINPSTGSGEGEAFIARGKYLVDDSGHPMFLVDPGVCGTYPFRQEELKGEAKTLPIPADAATELGLDRQAYKRVEIKETTSGLGSGAYLVDQAGNAKYFLRAQSKFDAPKAQLFRLIIDGTLGGKLPWGLVLIGVFLAFMMELVGVSALPFAVGLYLPISTSAGIFVGGICRWLVDRKRKDISAAEAEFSPGMLMASGLIAGGAIAGVVQAVIAFYEKDEIFDLSQKFGLAQNGSWWPMTPFLIMAAVLVWVGVRKEPSATPSTKAP
jgi:putative OPT family oligopeptide transporter